MARSPFQGRPVQLGSEPKRDGGKKNTEMLTVDGYYSVAVAEAAEIAVLEKRIVEIVPPQL